ncbi:MAG TPA: ABC transporter permease [Candidatus Sumerlaeota bacterium]|nr:ABC transporter permease [Candidatus Sumerlaeota bacterium]HMZ52969.1 ABC transporter permease [Candidatus Sumerlaeota bacterium]HNM46004.1 ABC transporter permease [Candidatus Sumerlaeota bacterium]
MTEFLRQWLLVFRRERNALLTLPLYYVLCGIFFLLTALIYLGTLVEFSRGGEGTTVNATASVIRPVFHMVHFFLLVQIPLLTMRVFSEEHANGMLELLQTTRLRDWALLLGKFTGTFGAMAIYLLLTFLFPITTAMLGTVEWPVVIGGMLALLASAAAYTAIGIFFSALTESQVVAAVFSYVALFLLVFSQALADTAHVGALQDFTRHFSVMEHVGAILSGNIAVMNVAYFVLLTITCLFLTARALELRHGKA